MSSLLHRGTARYIDRSGHSPPLPTDVGRTFWSELLRTVRGSSDTLPNRNLISESLREVVTGCDDNTIEASIDMIFDARDEGRASIIISEVVCSLLGGVCRRSEEILTCKRSDLFLRLLNLCIARADGDGRAAMKKSISFYSLITTLISDIVAPSSSEIASYTELADLINLIFDLFGDESVGHRCDQFASAMILSSTNPNWNSDRAYEFVSVVCADGFDDEHTAALLWNSVQEADRNREMKRLEAVETEEKRRLATLRWEAELEVQRVQRLVDRYRQTSLYNRSNSFQYRLVTVKRIDIERR